MTEEKAKFDLQDAWLIVGVLLIVGGVAIVSKPAAVIVMGVLVVAGCVFDAWLKAVGL
jgi:hypothetical protein